MIQFRRLLIFIFMLFISECFSQHVPENFRLEPLRQYNLENDFNTLNFEHSIERAVAVLPPSNDNCANARSLTVNGGCSTDTSLSGATTQPGENLTPSCMSAGGTVYNRTVWFSFTATQTNMWSALNITGFEGNGGVWAPGDLGVAIYSGSCVPTNFISCRNINSQGTGDGIIENILSGLTIGQTYYIQVGYKAGNGGTPITPTFCIKVGDQFTPACNTCANPCGAACGYTVTPTVSTVTTTCPPYNQLPPIEGAVADTQCYTFYAVNTTVSFNVIVNSTCQSGNVTNFTWNLYSGANCTTPIQSGTLSNLTFTGLTIRQQYRFCYSFSVPANCYHTAYYPYFVGASPLPVDLIEFNAAPNDRFVRVNWTTASEINNDRFELERSYDGFVFDKIAVVQGAGNSTSISHYDFYDSPGKEFPVYYYRLSQLDFDGTKNTFDVIAVRNLENDKIAIGPNPVVSEASVKINSSGEEQIEISVETITGQTVLKKDYLVTKGYNNLLLDMALFSPGLYLLKMKKADSVFCRIIEKASN